MVRILTIIILSLMAVPAYAAQSLQLSIDEKTVMLGKGLHARVIATNLDTPLTRINLDALKYDFGLEVIESANHDRGNDHVQELSLLLFPRNTGLHTLPALSLNRFSSHPVNLTVLEARNAAGVIDFISDTRPKAIWQRQQVRLEASIITASKFSRLQPDEFKQAGFEIIPLAVTRERLPDGRYKLTSGWDIYPLIDGKQTLYPPAINLRLSGKVQQKFYPPTQQLTIRPLPSYIPPLMPVGRLSINNTINDDYQWQLELQSDMISPTSLASLPLPITTVAGIHYGEVVTSAHGNKTRPAIVSQNIPLTFDYSGVYTLPDIVIKTFDPASGKIITQRSPSKVIVYLNTWLKIVLAIVALIIASKLTRLIRDKLQRIAQRRAIIQSALSATSPHALHDVLNQYADNQYWGNNLTLSQWQRIWDRQKKSSSSTIIEKLSHACYAQPSNTHNQQALNQDVYGLLKN